MTHPASEPPQAAPAGSQSHTPPELPDLQPALGLLHATALNVTHMIGTSAALTTPLFLAAMLGPQVFLGWAAGSLLALCDGLVWAELSAAAPGSGGPIVFLREAFGRYGWGRFFSFLFVWQTVLVAPLLIACAALALARHLADLVPGMAGILAPASAAAILTVAATALATRRMRIVRAALVVFFAGAVAALLWVGMAGLVQGDWRRILSLPPPPFDLRSAAALGAGLLAARLDLQGYATAAYLGGEVWNPSCLVPRSILLSVVLFSLLFLLLPAGLVSLVSWDGLVSRSLPAGAAGPLLPLLLVWCTAGAVFTQLVAYSRVPFAAARERYLPAALARVHPRLGSPHVAVLALGAVSAGMCLAGPEMFIPALLTLAVLTPFVTQCLALLMLRRRLPEAKRPFRMGLFPLPLLVTLAGWVGLLAAGGWARLGQSLALLALGGLFYLLAARRLGFWPFESDT